MPNGARSTSRPSKESCSTVASCSTKQISTPRSRGSMNSTGRPLGFKMRQAECGSASRLSCKPTTGPRWPELLTEDIVTDDRRQVIGAGVQRGRDANIANLRASRTVGIDERDVDRHRDPRGAPRPRSGPFLGAGSAPEPFHTEILRVLRGRRRRSDRSSVSFSTSTTSTPPSQNSTPATSQEKRHRTRVCGSA